MFIYKSVARIISNDVGRVIFISVATLIVRGRRIYREYGFFSRFRGIVFSFGMAGGGVNAMRNKTCPELNYCQQQEICYKFNIFNCTNPNCPFYHVCKRCWFVEETSKYHASNDVAKCPNMTDSYRVSVEEAGGGVAPPRYYHYNNEARSPEEVAAGEGLSNRRTSSSSSWRSRLAPQHQFTFSPAESSGIMSSQTQSLPEERQKFLIEERHECHRESAPVTASSTTVGSGSNVTPEGSKYRRIVEVMQRQSNLLEEERKINESLRSDNLKLRQQLEQKENVERENQDLERENQDLRQKLEEEVSRKSKVRVVHAPMQPYSRLQLLGNLPSGFSGFQPPHRPENTQIQSNLWAEHIPNLGSIDVPPLFNNSKNQLNSKGDHVSSFRLENPSVPTFQGSSRGSGPSHRTGNLHSNEDIFNLYENGADSKIPESWLSGNDQETTDWM